MKYDCIVIDDGVESAKTTADNYRQVSVNGESCHPLSKR